MHSLRSFNGIVLLVALLVAGCTTVKPMPDSSPEVISKQQRHQLLSSLHQWDIQGSMAIRTPEQADSARIHWQQNNRDYRIQLFGPLGAGNTVIVGKPNDITLTNAKGEKLSAQNPETLMQQQLGWSLPVSNLFYWVRALPAPDSEGTKNYDQFGRLETLKQQGWTIHYLKYSDAGPYEVPSKIRFVHDDLQILLVINTWFKA